MLDRAAVAFSNRHVAPAKIINDFAKKLKALEIQRYGAVEGAVSSVEEIKAAALPNREGMLSMLSQCCKRLYATLLTLSRLLPTAKTVKAET